MRPRNRGVGEDLLENVAGEGATTFQHELLLIRFNTPSETTFVVEFGSPSIRSSNRWKIIIITTKSGSCSIMSIGVVSMQPCASYHHRFSLLSICEFLASSTRDRRGIPTF